MHCIIFKSLKKADTYLYICGSLDNLPPELSKVLAPFKQVMELSLYPTKNLAYADAKKVLNALLHQGFYLQIPKEQTLAIQRFNETIYAKN